MTIKERDLLLKINKQVKKLTTPPPTTYAPQTGEVQKPKEYQPTITPIPLPPSPKYKG